MSVIELIIYFGKFGKFCLDRSFLVAEYINRPCTIVDVCKI